MTTYTTAAQLDGLPTGTIITPVSNLSSGGLDTAYHSAYGHYLLCGSITHYSVETLLDFHPTWVQVKPRGAWPDAARANRADVILRQLINFIPTMPPELTALVGAARHELLSPDHPACPRCSGTGYLSPYTFTRCTLCEVTP